MRYSSTASHALLPCLAKCACIKAIFCSSDKGVSFISFLSAQTHGTIGPSTQIQVKAALAQNNTGMGDILVLGYAFPCASNRHLVFPSRSPINAVPPH
jgi:hypothetical protein